MTTAPIKKRGRPPKVVEPEPTDAEARVAKYLSGACGMPGCTPRFHLSEARELVRIINGNSSESLSNGIGTTVPSTTKKK